MLGYTDLERIGLQVMLMELCLQCDNLLFEQCDVVIFLFQFPT
jgi:hypothetical protein